MVYIQVMETTAATARQRAFEIRARRSAASDDYVRGLITVAEYNALNSAIDAEKVQAKMIPVSELMPGMVVKLTANSEPHVIAEIEPYTGPIECIAGIARATDGWGISIAAGSSVHLMDVA